MGQGRGSDLWGSLANRGQQFYNTTIWYPASVLLRPFEFILSLAVLGILARIIDDYNLSAKFPGVGYYIWVALGASIASIVLCIAFVLSTLEDVHWAVPAIFMAVDSGLLIVFIYVSVIFLEQVAGISCEHSASDRILNGWSTEFTLTKHFAPDIQALTKTTVAHCVAIKSAFYMTVALSLLYCFSTGFSLGLFWKKFSMEHGSGGRGGKGGQQMQYHNRGMAHDDYD